VTLKYDLVNYTVLLSLRAPVSAAEVMRTEGGNFTTSHTAKQKKQQTHQQTAIEVAHGNAQHADRES
jgi:hypothetical protein